MKKITVLIPCYNEEKGLGKVIDDIPIQKLQNYGYDTSIIVVDNNSTDKTSKVARSRKVRLAFEKNKGKGNAIKTGLRLVSSDTDYIIMLDGDNTYKAKEIPRMIEPLENDFCDVVVGSRLGGKIKDKSLKFSNRVVNWGFTFLVRQFYRANVTDVLSGFFAWKKHVVDEMLPYLHADGFAIEMEMITKMVKLKYQVFSVPITYDMREGISKIEALKDGSAILNTFFRYLFWQPKLPVKVNANKLEYYYH